MIHRTKLKIAHNTILVFSQPRNDWRNRIHIRQPPNHLDQETKIKRPKVLQVTINVKKGELGILINSGPFKQYQF